MATLPTPDETNIITRAPFLAREIGEIIAWHDHEGPSIDFRLAPEDTDQHAEISFTPSEVHKLADQLHEIATVAQHAGWTPEILAQARARYLPGMSDVQIIERLDRLADRIGGLVFGVGGRLHGEAGRMLTAEVGLEALDRVAAAVDVASQQLDGVHQLTPALTELREAIAGMRRFYQAETERKP
ncbi:hypothetical protein [Jiangella muralis]|uniref:hypothetical protein n=1 Tax=Jiangella muralis TaxID=702383 RepID=UPI00069D772A|nr:hypothetical protein [Jiangella muralis]